jgi:hypothetical protein
MFTREILVEARRRALRRGVWFKALDGVERGILSLASQIINTVRSSVLSVQLVKIIAKIRDACKSGFIKHLEQFGMTRVRVIQAQAFSFGYEGAKMLSNDFDFVRYLAFLDFNQPIGWGAFKK